MQKVLDELEKCELYCVRCHMELHHPTLAFNMLDDTIKNLEAQNVFKQIEGYCVICTKKLDGKKTKFCSPKCRNAYHQNYANQQLRGIERKLKLVAMLGGECNQCGYNDNLAGLDFHHAGEKDYKLDLRNLANRTWKTVLKEAESCVLLCSNCHMEEHNPELTLEKITKTHSV